MRRFVGCALWTLLVASTATARDFHVDPINGADAGDGSAAQPWRTLAEVMRSGQVRTRHWDALPYRAGATLVGVNPNAPVAPGDTLVLHAGNHGDVLIQGAYNEQPITVRAAAGAQPRLERLWLRAAGNWRFDGILIEPAPGGNPASGPLLRVETHAHHGPSQGIELINSVVRSAASHAGWNAATWVASAYDGIIVDGADHVIRANRFETVHHGISVNGPNTLVDGNQVTDFSGDGMRGLGDGGTFQYNLIRNNYAVDENHDDGFQSWSRNGAPVRDITLRGNVFIDHSDPNQPLRGILQGIGCFDGFYEGWLVENNVMIVEHAHAITLLGARDSLIINNTAHNPFGGGPGPAWIRIDNHKDGRASAGVIVRNNLVDALVLGNGVEGDTNIIVEEPERFYVDPAGNMRLLPNAPAIDAGNAVRAPRIDQAGVPRPQGAGVDVGAFEWTDAVAPEPDAPEPDAPEPDAPEPDAPEPDAPQPDAPEPDAPEPDAPQPDAPEPDAPEPETPDPETPEPLPPPPPPPEPEPSDAGPRDAFVDPMTPTPGVRTPEDDESAGFSTGCMSGPDRMPSTPMGWGSLAVLGWMIRRRRRAAR